MDREVTQAHGNDERYLGNVQLRIRDESNEPNEFTFSMGTYRMASDYVRHDLSGVEINRRHSK